MPRKDDHPGRPEFLVKLGLLLPCNEQDVKEAYLAKVRKVHPDVGGDIHDFIELQEAFESALEYARFQATRTGWLATNIERYALQEKVIARIKELGGHVELAQINWLAHEIGEDFAQVMERLVGIHCQGAAFDDRIIDFLVKHQSALGYLKKLDLSESGITDAGLLRLRVFTNLHELDISRTDVGNAGLKVLNHLTHLEWLGLEETSVNVLGYLQLGWNRPYLQVSRSGRKSNRVSLPHYRFVLCISVLYLVAMFLATHMHVSSLPRVAWMLLIPDKVIHAVIYGGLAALSSLLLVVSSPVPHDPEPFRWKRKMVGLWFALAAYGLFDEVTQLATGRTFEWLDWAADLVGITVGILAFQFLVVVARRFAQSVWRLQPTEVEKIEHLHRLRNFLFIDLPT